MDVNEGGFAYYSAAIRELFEEAGILLCKDKNGNYPDRINLDKYRRDLKSTEVIYLSNNTTRTAPDQGEILGPVLKCSCFMIINFNLKFFFKTATFLLKSQHLLNDPSPN